MEARVAVFGILRFPPEKITEVKKDLQLLIDSTYREDGCIAYDVAEDVSDPGLLRFSELWPDHESLSRHLKAPHIGPWREASKRCSLIERKFTAYDIGNSKSV